MKVSVILIKLSILGCTGTLFSTAASFCKKVKIFYHDGQAAACCITTVEEFFLDVVKIEVVLISEWAEIHTQPIPWSEIETMDRFIRTRSMLGQKRFQRLQTAKITVVGLGAVGGYVVEGLVRAGVQNVRLIDFDTIEPSNLNRQIFALETTIGRPKAEVARERVLAINSDCRVESLQLFAGEETLDEILDPQPDLLIDAIDSLNPKTGLLYTAWIRKIPTISSMGAALRTDPALIRCGDLFSTTNCPLARHVRKRLRRRGVKSGICCVYSTENIEFDYHTPEDETQVDETPFSGRGRKRNILGSLPTITGIFGLTIANQAIKQLTCRS